MNHELDVFDGLFLKAGGERTRKEFWSDSEKSASKEGKGFKSCFFYWKLLKYVCFCCRRSVCLTYDFCFVRLFFFGLFLTLLHGVKFENRLLGSRSHSSGSFISTACRQHVRMST